MTEKTRIETDLVNQIVRKLNVSWEEAFDIAIEQLTTAKAAFKESAGEIKDWDSGHLYSVWVYCVGTWDNGEPHTWHSRRHDSDNPSHAVSEAWRDFEAHARWIPEASHDGYEFVLLNW